MSQIETQYNEFTSSISKIIPSIDVNLMIKIMYLERRLPDVSPRVELHIEYNSKTNPLEKQEIMREKYGFPTQTSTHGLTAVGQMNMQIIEEISKDQDIQHISGTATPASY